MSSCRKPAAFGILQVDIEKNGHLAMPDIMYPQTKSPTLNAILHW